MLTVTTKNGRVGTSLVVQWLGIHLSMKGTVSTLGQRTKTPHAKEYVACGSLKPQLDSPKHCNEDPP